MIVPSLTFVASFQAVAATGAKPIACDVHDDTLLMDLDDVRKRLTPRTRALMPIHYTGAPCDMDAILAFAAEHKLRVIEDAAHAFGSTYKGRKVGSFGDVACFSFDSIKNISCGEGGAITCAGAAEAERMRHIRNLGMNRKGHAGASWKDRTWRFDVTSLGFRYHMSNINAAIGLAQLPKLEGFIAHRRKLCCRYLKGLSNVAGLRLIPVDYSTVAPHIFVARVLDGRRDEMMSFLRERDIETGINYVPNHTHPIFEHTGGPLPVTERAFEEILTLPLHAELSETDIDTVVGAIREFLSR